MIDPKELRIGNYLFCISQDEEKIATSFTISLVDKGIIDDYSPIPITPEWLERLGFERWHSRVLDRDDWCVRVEGELGVDAYSFGDRFLYVEVIDANMWCPFNVKPIQYVHQLQNLFFALTGTELTVKEPQTT